MTDPAVADAAYSYQRGLWLAARIAVRMSGPAKVGMGELSITARATVLPLPGAAASTEESDDAIFLVLVPPGPTLLAIYQGAGGACIQAEGGGANSHSSLATIVVPLAYVYATISPP